MNPKPIINKIRLAMFIILILGTGFLVFVAFTAKPDPGYGRLPIILANGLIAFIAWVPYNIFCMFLDGNKKFGRIAITISCLAILGLAIAMWLDDFGLHWIALMFFPMVIFLIWVLSVINFVGQKRRLRIQKNT